ncbi:hypothetical protein INS49_007387 [Diaporthe citri]|uniref:uncharacterized protein n=1 Tax=Diaporthe citri TaxID=83186 RepID=UPI001C7FB93C|nr:uncharacterized protein INS49_007387 [Diaporthe citri]KAG6365776.1 hypothetical protein INS49_007387 [Diaporthe citri]
MPLFSCALVPPAIAKAQDDKQDLTIVYHKANSDVTVEVLSGGNLVGQSCSSSLSSGAFEKLPIIFDVNERASGNLTVGSSTYLNHVDANYSGDIVCARMFNHAEAAASCTVAVPANLPMQPLSKSNISECISDHRNRLAKFLRASMNPPGGSTDAGQAEMIIDPRPNNHTANRRGRLNVSAMVILIKTITFFR